MLSKTTLPLLLVLAVTCSSVVSSQTVPPTRNGLPAATDGRLDLEGTDTTEDAALNAIQSYEDGVGVDVEGEDEDTYDVDYTPAGYQLEFGPLQAASNANGYMGYVAIPLTARSPVDECAAICNSRAPDARGGSCQFFNIWHGVVNKLATQITCSLYYVPHTKKQATNGGQGALSIRGSRGYLRVSLALDGGFEKYPCASDFCYGSSYQFWEGISHPNGSFDATIFYYNEYAHSGHGVALLGSGEGTDEYPGTLQPRRPLQTTRGRKYVVEFWHSSSYSSPEKQKDSFVEVWWNGNVIVRLTPGYSPWLFYQVPVPTPARGGDTLAFHGGKAPAWSFIDDVRVVLQ